MIRVSVIRSPEPTTRLTSRMSATEGTGRRNSTMARVANRTPGRLPRMSPSGTAITVASSSPRAHAATVAPRSARNRPSVTSLAA
jgi:hypothetical protein